MDDQDKSLPKACDQHISGYYGSAPPPDDANAAPHENGAQKGGVHTRWPDATPEARGHGQRVRAGW